MANEDAGSGNKWIAPAGILAGGAIVVALLLRGQQTLEEPVPTPVATAEADVRPQTATTVTRPAAGRAAADLIARSRQLESAGRLDEALATAQQAMAAGAHRDGALQAAKIEILRENYGAARALLQPLTSAQRRDADAEYNLGLIAQRQRKYNDARTHYLSTLQVEPQYAAARFNLAVLARDFGFTDEAGHHAQEFAKAWPQDPRVKDLAPLLQSGPAK